MYFSNIDFTIKYLDPSATTNGNGTSPETPMNAFPTTIDSLGNNTAWIVRRTNENYSANLPCNSTDTIQNILFVGMPKEGDDLWNMMPLIAKEVWGSDEAEYANIKVDSSYNSFCMNQGKTFLLHRLYLFRDNTSASNSMFKFPAQDYSAEISIEHCKFGCRSVNIDQDDFTSSTNNSYCKMFFNINSAHVFSMHHCIINVVNSGMDYYGETSNHFNITNVNFSSIFDVDVYTTTSQYGSSYGPSGGTVIYLSNTNNGESYINCQNLRFHILINNDWGYLPQLFYSSNTDYCVMKNITADLIERKLGNGNPSAIVIEQYMIRSQSNREFQVENIHINLPKCWRITENGRVFSFAGYSNSNMPGHCKILKNITINMAEINGIDNEKNGNYYDNVKYGTNEPSQYPYYSALELNFNEYSFSEGSWEPVVASDIHINHLRGVALYAYGCQIRNSSIKGTIKLCRCVADIESVESYYPGYALFAADATTLKVGMLTLGKENASETGGGDDPAIGSRYSDNSFIYVGSSNGILKGKSTETTSAWNGYNFICGNEIDSGHYTCRSYNYLCDTWNVARVGGAPATWKFTSSAESTNGMILGRSPFKGIQLTPETTGNYQFVMHIATKGLSNLDNLNSQIVIQLTIPRADGTEEVIFSSTKGQWLDDIEAEWVNDSEIEQRKLVIPLYVTEVNMPIDVKLHYKLYSGSGYVYIDPAFELTPKQ